jgi:WD40 repeat protein
MQESYAVTLLRSLSAGSSSYSTETLNHAMNASGTRSIATSRQGVMTVFDIDRGEYSEPYDGDCGDVWGVALSNRDSRALTVAAPARYIHSGDDHWFLGLWDIDKDELVSRFKIDPGCYRSAASPDLQIAMGAHRGRISWWDPEGHKCVGSAANPHSQDVFRLAISHSGAIGASTSTREVFLWDIHARKPIKSMTLPKPKLFSKQKLIGSVRFGADHLYMGSNDGKVWVTDLSGTMLEMIIDTGHKLWVESFDILEERSLAALLIWGGRLELWDLYSGKLVGAVETGHEGRVSDIRIKPDASSVVSAGMDGTVRVWSLQERQRVTTMILSFAGGFASCSHPIQA